MYVVTAVCPKSGQFGIAIFIEGVAGMLNIDDFFYVDYHVFNRRAS